MGPYTGRPSGAVVRGTVTDPSGVPVQGASIRAFAIEPGSWSGERIGECRGKVLETREGITDAAGSFEATITPAKPPFQGCIGVMVDPPAGSSWRAGEAGGPVRFITLVPGAVPDTVRLSIQLGS